MRQRLFLCCMISIGCSTGAEPAETASPVATPTGPSAAPASPITAFGELRELPPIEAAVEVLHELPADPDTLWARAWVMSVDPESGRVAVGRDSSLDPSELTFDRRVDVFDRGGSTPVRTHHARGVSRRTLAQVRRSGEPDMRPSWLGRFTDSAGGDLRLLEDLAGARDRILGVSFSHDGREALIPAAMGSLLVSRAPFETQQVLGSANWPTYSPDSRRLAWLQVAAMADMRISIRQPEGDVIQVPGRAFSRPLWLDARSFVAVVSHQERTCVARVTVGDSLEVAPSFCLPDRPTSYVSLVLGPDADSVLMLDPPIPDRATAHWIRLRDGEVLARFDIEPRVAALRWLESGELFVRAYGGGAWALIDPALRTRREVSVPSQLAGTQARPRTFDAEYVVTDARTDPIRILRIRPRAD